MQRINLSTNTAWEPVVGYSRAVRIGDAIHVTGSTATTPDGGHTGDGDAHAQACQIFRNIEAALQALGGTLADVVRTRIYVVNIDDWEDVGHAHGEVFRKVLPACTLVAVAQLVYPAMLVEIEATAVIIDA